MITCDKHQHLLQEQLPIELILLQHVRYNTRASCHEQHTRIHGVDAVNLCSSSLPTQTLTITPKVNIYHFCSNVL